MIATILIYTLIYILNYRLIKYTAINWFNDNITILSYNNSRFKKEENKIIFLSLSPLSFIATMLVYEQKYWTLKTIKPNQ